MPTVTEKHKQEAERIMEATADGLLPQEKAPWIATIALTIAAAEERVKPPPGHILDDTRTVRRVLGTLPLTADGCVATPGCELWTTVVERFPLIFQRSLMNASHGYSTREAALAAKGTP